MKLEFLKKIKVFLQKHIKKVFFLLGIIIFLFLVSFIVRFKNRNVVAVIDGYKITLEEIVAELEEQMQILEGLRKMKTEAQKKINQILADVWGVEYVETVKVEVEDEQEN